jgi:hypothetical protein
VTACGAGQIRRRLLSTLAQRVTRLSGLAMKQKPSVCQQDTGSAILLICYRSPTLARRCFKLAGAA